MNAFKLGQEVKSSEGVLEGKELFYPLNKNNPLFSPIKKSTVFYPPPYKDLYAPNGDFAKAISSVFAITGTFDQETQITALSVEKKL